MGATRRDRLGAGGYGRWEDEEVEAGLDCLCRVLRRGLLKLCVSMPFGTSWDDGALEGMMQGLCPWNEIEVR